MPYASKGAFQVFDMSLMFLSPPANTQLQCPILFVLGLPFRKFGAQCCSMSSSLLCPPGAKDSSIFILMARFKIHSF